MNLKAPLSAITRGLFVGCQLVFRPEACLCPAVILVMVVMMLVMMQMLVVVVGATMTIAMMTVVIALAKLMIDA